MQWKIIPGTFLMWHHMEANMWIHKAGQLARGSGETQAVDSLITTYGQKFGKKKKKELCLVFKITLDLQVREKRRCDHWTSAPAQKPHGSAGKGLLVSIHPSSLLLERKLGLNPSSSPHTLLVQSLNSVTSEAGKNKNALDYRRTASF